MYIGFIGFTRVIGFVKFRFTGFVGLIRFGFLGLTGLHRAHSVRRIYWIEP